MSNEVAVVSMVERGMTAVAKSTGKSYTFSKLHYDVNGTSQSVRVIDFALRDIIDELRKGDTVMLTFEQDGKYKTLVAVTHTDGAATTSTPPSDNKKSHTMNDGAIGMQVGNALTNAATLIACGYYTDMTLELAAEKVLVVGNNLRTRLQNGEING